MKLRREVSHGGIVPRGWRMAWYEPQRRIGVYYPAPLHVIVRIARELGYRLRLAMDTPPAECAQVFGMARARRERERLAEEFSSGYMAGWNECFEACMDAVQEEFLNRDQVWRAGKLVADSGREN